MVSFSKWLTVETLLDYEINPKKVVYQLNTRNEDVEAKLRHMKNEVENCAKVTELTEKLKEKETENANLCTFNSELEIEMEKKSAEVSKLVQQIESLRELEKKSDEKTKEIEKQQAEHEIWTEKFESSQGEILELRAEISSKEEKLEEASAELENQIKAVKRLECESEQEKLSSREEVAGLLRLVKETKRIESQKTISLEMQQKRNEKLCRELAETCSKLADLELELEEKNDTLQIQAENNELENALEINAKMEKKIETFQRELSEKMQKLEECQEQGEKLRAHLVDVRLDLEAQKAINNELQAQYGE